MARTDIDRLSDDASIWIFGITPALTPDQSAVLLRHVDAFLDQWKAHGVPVTAGRELRDGRFLIVAAEANSEKSGCSIDSMFRVIRGIEKEHSVSMLDANHVFFRRADGSIESAPRPEFARHANAETVVFDTTAERLGDVRQGAWERPARDSWHAALLG